MVYNELTINERQKTDGQFCSMLDEVRCTRLSAESTNPAMAVDSGLGGRQVSRALSPVCLFPTRKSCDAFNSQMLDTEVVEIPCIDEVDETAGTRKWNERQLKSCRGSTTTVT